MEQKSPLHRAIEAAGGDASFMKKVGIGKRLFYYLRNGRAPSVAIAIRIEQATGVPRDELRPDIFVPFGPRKRAEVSAP